MEKSVKELNIKGTKYTKGSSKLALQLGSQSSEGHEASCGRLLRGKKTRGRTG